MNGKRVAVVTISADLLRNMLIWPDNVEIVGGRHSMLLGSIELRIESPDLPLVEEGHAIPHVVAQYATLGNAPMFLGFQMPDQSFIVPDAVKG